MQKLNLGTRVEMFAICSSIEFDIKKFISESTSTINFTQDMRDKAKSRSNELNKDEDILNQLDLGDYVTLITSSPYLYGINNDKAVSLQKYFKGIIPVRNRVMHTKPLELGDRSILIEVMDSVEERLPWIKWSELKQTKKMLEEDSSKLFTKKYIGIKDYNPKVYHNLPLPEFDDTGFVGRKKDIKEINELLLNKKNQVISVVGNGGMGKTSTVLKILYDLIERPDNPYEAIIWITLKTKTLSGGEFVEIQNSIRNVSEILLKSREVMQLPESANPKDAVLEFMEVFKVLLVLDNLETINTGEINEFIRLIPENSKVLITSRLGIGEFEVRQKIEGLTRNDAIMYYRELSKYYGLNLHKQSDDEIYEIVNENLYNNPLSIKWYISGVYSGTSAKQMLAHKNELIDFCISNIYDKLTNISRKILQLFLVEKGKLTYGLIDYYVDEKELDIRNSINELLSTYMIQASSGEYIMNDMSREYISINYPPSNDFVKDVMQKRKKLKNILQQVKVYVEQAPFNPNTIVFSFYDVDQQLATYHLRMALQYGKEKNWNECKNSLEKAASIEPDFYEVYKTKAFLDAEKGELFSAMNNYDIALSKCVSNKERAVVYYLYSVFSTVKMQDIDSALDYILKAEQYAPNSYEIKLEKVRVYTFLGKYDEAEELWNDAKKLDKHPNMRTLNIMANRYMDLKHRQASILQKRDYVEKYRIIKDGIDVLEQVPSVDMKSIATLLKLIGDLSYLYFHKDSMILLKNTAEKYAQNINRIDKKVRDKLIKNLEPHKEDIDKEVYEAIYQNMSSFKEEAYEITNENEGVVVKLKDTFGFIANSSYTYRNGLYFSRFSCDKDISIGDRVTFEKYLGIKGEVAKNVRKAND